MSMGIAGNVSKNDYPFSFRKITKDLIGKLSRKNENSLNGIQISDYKIENIANLDKPIIESFTFVTGNHCEIIGGKCLFKLF
jgi:hypothetical protein